ncbi:DUF6705 family protein [uncultured Chryseobacterium sp.]|uniref:DUF6705 family protein n=1 Tax=uncultured Chryseobacterium sp. TaxID=259322 RepID=UPI0025CCE03F|nr:DUF6705 family protein [uncultured Chryseobacterium sp.]
MKNKILKKILIVKSALFLTTACKAQQIYPLKTDYTEIPQNSYLKDIQNELDFYVGKWKANFNGNTMTIFITKEIHRFFNGTKYKYYKDVLSVRYIIQNSSNVVLQDTQSLSFTPEQIKHSIYSQWAEDNGNTILLYYGGTNCGVGWGNVSLKKISSTQLSWEYIPNSTIIDNVKCPPGTDTTIYLPETKDLIFTKQ